MADLDIERLGVGASIRLILSHRRLRKVGVQVFKAAVREFFIPQFESRLFLSNRPVAVMSHPLDDSLPFLPHLFRRYLGYITVWLKTLSCLYRIFGKDALGHIEQMMRDVVLIYDAAGRVYRRCQTTTTSRRSAPANPYFLLIAVFDPHLHCIPSLHVLTICYNYYQTRNIAARLDPCNASGSALVAQSYTAALRITEATLLVKQHSLVDIGPSLFLLSRLFPGYDEKEIRRFVSDLFSDTSVLDPHAAGRVRRAIAESYRQLLPLQDGRTHPAEVLLEYLRKTLESNRKIRKEER